VALSGGIGTLLIMLIVQKSSLKKDTALGIILSVFFGLGLVLLTFIQKKAIAQQALLNKFLFGNASTLLLEEVYCIVGLSLFILTCIMLFWKEFKLITFDPLLARSLGYSVVALDCWLTFLLVLGITIGLQTVGVVLMSTLFIAPAVAARQWVCSFGSLLVLAGFFGALSAIIGVIVSSLGDHMPTGPMIVIIMSSIVFLSLCCAPRIHRMRKKKYEYSA
jgi:manganese/zinc/iron transport system permease protein